MGWRNLSRLERDLGNLSMGCTLWIDDDNEFFITVIKLPPGYNQTSTELLVEIPSDYPLSPPGVGNSRVYVNPSLRFHGHRLADLHEDRTPDFDTPGHGPWAWLCYEQINWSPARDDLIKCVEMVRADLTQPKTKSAWSFL